MIHLLGPYVLASVLIGLGVTGILRRRNAVVLLIGVELVLAGALILFVTVAARSVVTPGADRWSAGTVLPLFVMTIAAAEVIVALAIILAAYRQRASIDVDSSSDLRGDRVVDLRTRLRGNGTSAR